MQEIIINASVLANSIKTLKPFMSQEETRYYLCGVHFELSTIGPNQDVLYMVATDGHKLCVLEHDCPAEFDGKLSAIIPAKALNTISTMLKGLEAECPIQLRFTETQVFIDALDEKGEFKLIDGEYPNWRGVLPTRDPNFTIGLGKAQAREAMKACVAASGSEGLEWRMIDAASPLLMKGKDKTVLVMPMRVSLPGEDAIDRSPEDMDSESDEALFLRAKEVCARTGKCSTSYIQRELKVGYNRAARAVEWLEGEGFVSGANHVGKREVLIATPSEEDNN